LAFNLPSFFIFKIFLSNAMYLMDNIELKMNNELLLNNGF